MTQISREVVEGRIPQGVGESIAYQLDTTNWCTTPTNPSCALFTTVNGVRTDVSASKMFGSPMVDGHIVTSSVVTALAAGVEYRLEFTFSCGTNTFVAFVLIVGEY